MIEVNLVMYSAGDEAVGIPAFREDVRVCFPDREERLDRDEIEELKLLFADFGDGKCMLASEEALLAVKEDRAEQQQRVDWQTRELFEQFGTGPNVKDFAERVLQGKK